MYVTIRYLILNIQSPAMHRSSHSLKLTVLTLEGDIVEQRPGSFVSDLCPDTSFDFGG